MAQENWKGLCQGARVTIAVYIEAASRAMRILRSPLLVVLVGLSAINVNGCSNPTHAIRTDSLEPIKARLNDDDSILVQGKYLILPIEAEANEIEKVYGSAVFSGSCWSGTDFGGLWGSLYTLNLEVVELETNGHHRVFDRQVALGSWRMSLEGTGSGYYLRYPDQLILPARTSDVNKDGFITKNDPVWLFLYDIKKHQTTKISPQGYHVGKVDLLPDRIVMVVQPENDRNKSAVYGYEPQKGEGRLIVEGMTP
ncbi:MAG TPA: hypothetical protein VJZ71_13245 [Phycisphaerae bacterium]|nr:hypothetical protein [Phycisphaerae bacterium]